jgi:hypothetical protein
VRDALAALPCVEQDSIKVDVPGKEARFTVKDKSQCTRQELNKAIEGAGFTLAAVKTAPASGSP